MEMSNQNKIINKMVTFKKFYNWLVSENFLAPGLTWKFIIKGLFLAVSSSILTSLYAVFSVGSLAANWHAILITALATAAAYLIKNVFTNSKDEFLKSEPKL
jgi:hypothetical protein